MAVIANGGRVPTYPRTEERRPARPSDVGGVPGTTYPKYPTPQPSRDLGDVLPWAVDIAPYEDFYTRSVISFLDWSAANDPAQLAPWIGGQPSPGAAPPGVALPAFAAPAYGGVGGGIGGGGGLPEPKFTMADIMQYMEFPQVWQYPSYMRDFGRYIEELLVQNPEYAVPLPELGEEGEIIPAPEDLDKLEYMETAENYAAAWNDFLQSLVNLPFFQQQEMLGLRYTPATRWYRSGDIPMLPHPEYL